MRKLNSAEKILVFCVGILTLLFIFNLLIFEPLGKRLNSMQQEIMQAQLALRKYLELGRHSDTILESQKQVERYLSLKGSDEERMAAILNRIEQEARKSGLAILDMSPRAGPETKSLPAVYRVQLRAEAEMAKITDFIYSLENTDILLKIEKFSLSTKDASSAVLKLDTSILGISLL